jgi:uncharacterized protein (TIGR02001 family)
MKERMMKKLTQAIALAGVMTTGLTATTSVFAEDVEVSASAAVASMYLWRGQDLGNGAAAVSGDLTASMGGAYAGVWTSSGDTAAGQEYDLYVGFGGEAEDFSYDLSIWTYTYSGDDTVNGEGNTFGLSEFIASAGFMGASASYYYPISSNPDDYSYLTLGYGMDAYSATIGMAMDDADGGYTHLDLSYAYNDSLAFTLSKIIDEETEDSMDDDLKVVVSYSLPIDM